MSENPMGGFPAPGSEQPQAAPAPAGRDPKVLIGGGVGLVVIAAIGGYLFLGGGGSGNATAPLPRPAVVGTHVTPTPSTTVIPVGKPTPPVRTFNGDVGRDPFQPLITQPPVKPVPTAKPTTNVSTAPTVAVTPGNVVGVTPTVPVGTLPPGTLPTGTVTAPSTVIPTTTTPPPTVLVVLKAIAFHGQTPYVVVSYSGKSYMLKTGDVGGADLKVVAIAPDDGTATFQLGDQTFDLHIGQSYVD